MENFKIGFIGSGNMGGALALAVSRAAGESNVVISDKNAEKAAELSKKIGCISADNKTVATECKYIFLGVKPQMISSLASEIAPYLSERKDKFTLISMAAGVKTEKIKALF
ncbi:MAG: pyrroline-5-carboxylate reductase family protein, partial [Eubacteriales bacterium]